jgi:hypothetical protein
MPEKGIRNNKKEEEEGFCSIQVNIASCGTFLQLRRH